MGDDAGREDGSVAGSHGRLGGRAGAGPQKRPMGTGVGSESDVRKTRLYIRAMPLVG